VRASQRGQPCGVLAGRLLSRGTELLPYSDRGVRKILARYTQAAGITASISLRHFLFTWLKTQGIDDALIQPYSGHATRQSLEISPASPWPMPSNATTTSSATSPV